MKNKTTPFQVCKTLVSNQCISKLVVLGDKTYKNAVVLANNYDHKEFIIKGNLTVNYADVTLIHTIDEFGNYTKAVHSKYKTSSPMQFRLQLLKKMICRDKS